MTKHKAEKRAIRDRMGKTGERYTTARHFHLALHRAAPGSLTSHPAPNASASLPATPAPQSGSAPSAPDRHVPVPATGDTTNAPATINTESANDSASESLTANTPDPVISGAGAQAGAGPAPIGDSAKPGPESWVEDPGMSDEAISRKTGRPWNDWFALLDTWGAAERTHTEIARYLEDTTGIGGWWAQAVTVGYERARGRRKVYERPDGFTITVSMTVAVPAERLFAAFVDADQRDQWLGPGTLCQRTSQPPRSARFDLLGTESRVHITITAKGDEKSMVQVEEIKLSGEDQVAPRKAFWKEKLAGLNTFLTA